METLQEAFSGLPDHRDKRGLQYSLDSLLLAVVVGFMCGCDSLLAVARLLKRMTREQREALGFLWFKVPCHTTLCITFTGFDVDALEKTLSRVALADAGDKPLHLAIDGKALRGTITKELPRGAQMLACFSDKLMGTVGQKATRGGYDEVTSAIALLKELPLKGSVVTGDAMFVDRHLCETIVQGGGDYVLPLKDNQPSLKRAAKAAVEKKRPLRTRRNTKGTRTHRPS